MVSAKYQAQSPESTWHRPIHPNQRHRLDWVNNMQLISLAKAAPFALISALPAECSTHVGAPVNGRPAEVTITRSLIYVQVGFEPNGALQTMFGDASAPRMRRVMGVMFCPACAMRETP